MPGGMQTNEQLTVSRAKGSQGSGTREKRVGIYGELPTNNVWPTKHSLADEGSYFVTTNPTIGTGVTHALSTAFSATVGLFVIKNNASVSSGIRCYLDYFRLLLTSTAATATVSQQFAFVTDTGNRVPTAGSQTLTPVNVNQDDSTASQVIVYAFSAAALTVPAAVSPRVVGRCSLAVSQVVTGDEYLVHCGGVDFANAPGLTAVRAAAPARLVANVAPIVIGPQQSLVIYRWCLTEATTAPAYEFEIGHIER